MSTISKKLIVAISSRALFDLTHSNEIFEQHGVEAYSKYQIENENKPLDAGNAFNFVKKLLNLNNHCKDLVEVILLSRNSTDSGLRIFNSIAHHNLNISRAAFTGGKSPFNYLQALGAHLYLSANQTNVKEAISQGYAAATLLTQNKIPFNTDTKLNIAFDGDAVLFSDESEQINQKHGLDAFTENEQRNAENPLNPGPFKYFIDALAKLQTLFPANDCPIRIALVTARSAPAHKRVINTLREWNIRIDEAFFLGNLSKADILKTFNADIFFDDRADNCDLSKVQVATGHVPYGISNEAINENSS